MRVWYANLRHLTPKVQVLQIAAQKKKNIPQIFMFVETFLSSSDPDPPSPIDGYVMVRQDRKTKYKKGGGGLAIYHHPDMLLTREVQLCTSSDTVEIMTVKIKQRDNNARNVILVYISPEEKLVTGLLQVGEIVEKLEDPNVLLLGDFNPKQHEAAVLHQFCSTYMRYPK